MQSAFLFFKRQRRRVNRLQIVVGPSDAGHVSSNVSSLLDSPDCCKQNFCILLHYIVPSFTLFALWNPSIKKMIFLLFLLGWDAMAFF
jgi:hypothetical protein